jgi:hypothetical protein
MKYQSYLDIFDEVLNGRLTSAPYNDPNFIEYTRLNHARMLRWEKTLTLNPELSEVIKNIQQPQQWIIISEPWCGDAATALPFLIRLAEINPIITYDIHLRDEEPFLINSYLTNGTKSIPKLIVRNENDKDLFTWGPRPKVTQDFIDELKHSHLSKEEVKAELQNWYNRNKGEALQKELLNLIKTYKTISGPHLV